jgi:hypothetical protein
MSSRLFWITHLSINPCTHILFQLPSHLHCNNVPDFVNAPWLPDGSQARPISQRQTFIILTSITYQYTDFCDTHIFWNDLVRLDITRRVTTRGLCLRCGRRVIWKLTGDHVPPSYLGDHQSGQTTPAMYRGDHHPHVIVTPAKYKDNEHNRGLCAPRKKCLRGSSFTKPARCTSWSKRHTPRL